jgi:hypothetical protein
MARSQSSLALLLLALVGCDANVVDAVREPAQMPVDVPMTPVQNALIHRYSFDGTGTEVRDSKYAAHGEVIGTTLPGSGALPLVAAEPPQYVDLPDGVVSGLTDATFEAWVTWLGTSSWQRIFDFGSNNSAELAAGAAASGTSYIFLTAASSANTPQMLPRGLRVSYSTNGVNDEEICQGPDTLPIAVQAHVAVVVSQLEQKMMLYQDGKLLSTCDLTRPLSAIKAENNWLGRSNYSGDTYFEGIFDEFRIYNAALSADEIADSFAAGPGGMSGAAGAGGASGTDGG